MALFHVLLELRRRKVLPDFRAAHVNHKWRGRESDADEQFCRELARSHEIEILVHQQKAGTPKTEEAARNVRRDFFRKVRRRNEWIALAHTTDDQAETVLWRICRGAGMDGLSGLLLVEKPVIRPLLELSRKQLREILVAAELPWREDATNQLFDRTRTLIRNGVFPVLEKVHPGARTHLAELARRHAEWNSWVQARASSELKVRFQKGHSLDARDWGLGPLVGRELLARWWRKRGLPDSALTDERLRDLERLATGEAKGPLPVPGERQVVRDNGFLKVRRKAQRTSR